MTQPDLSHISAQLDIRLDVCPMTFVKTTLELEELEAGDILEVQLREGEPLANVTRSCEEEGHSVLRKEKIEGPYWKIYIKKSE